MFQNVKVNRVFIVMAAAACIGMTGCKIQQPDQNNNQAPAAQAPAAQAPAAQAPAAVALPAALDMNTPMPLQIAALPVKGNPNAKVTLVEFSDYQCPYCSKVEPTIDALLKAYPNDLRVAFINHPLGFHQNAMPAAKAAYAAHLQGRHWDMHAALFANQRALTPEFFKAKAQELGLDMAKFEADMNSPETEKIINKGMDDARPYGIGGTPSFLINGVVFVGAQPLDNFKKVIDAELKRANDVAAAKNLSGDALYKELVASAPKPQKEEQRAEEKAPAGRVMVDLSTAPMLGDVNAPITIVEFTDFQCPFCSRGNTTVHQLIENNPGKIRLVFRHFPLSFHDKAKLAHQAAEAAKMQGKFWEYYDKLFANQDKLDRDNLINFAKELGLDEAKFVADMDSAAVAKIVDDDIKAGSDAGVQGTPHFLINGSALSGAQPLNAFQAAFDKELNAAKPYMDKGLVGNALYEQIIKDNQPAPLVVNIDGAPFKGPADAPVTLIQFSEFQCPFCSKVEPTIKALMDDPAYAGKIKVVFKQFPLGFHDKAHKAAEAALFAHSKGKFWELHEKMFANQSALDVDSLIKYAGEVGLNGDELKAALDANTFAKAVDADVEAGRNVGISGTPSFVINGELVVGALPVDAFKAKIDKALKAAAK